jgi:CBS domain-containing membrane protein
MPKRCGAARPGPGHVDSPTMKHNDPISHLMSRHVVTAHHGDSISKVRALVRQHGVHHVPVVNGDQLVGIITWSDILRVSFGDAFQTDERAVDATLDHTLTLEQVMQKNPVTLSETGTVRQAAEILAGGSFHSLPIVSGGKLVGIVTTTDLIKYLLEQF